MDPDVQKKVEELSSYIERVESQIMKLSTEASRPLEINNLVRRPDSALAVTDLLGPRGENLKAVPLTERR